MGGTCSSLGAGPSNSSPLNGRRPSTNDNEERKLPPSADADAQLAIVLQNQAMREADGYGDDPACLHLSTWQHESHAPETMRSAAAVRSRLLVSLQNLGWQLHGFLPFRDQSVLATTARGFHTLISQDRTHLDALPVLSYLISPLTDVKLLAEAGKEMRTFMRQEHALVENLASRMEHSGWSIDAVLNLMRKTSPHRFGAYQELTLLLSKAETGTLNQRERGWLCFSLSNLEPPELIEEAIAKAEQDNGESVRDLARRTAINYCVLEGHDLAERLERLKLREDELESLPKHSIASLKAKFAHVHPRDSLHQLSGVQRGQLVALSSQLTALRDEDPRSAGLLGSILAATERLQRSDPTTDGRIQTRRLLAKGFEHELNEHLVECETWIRTCSTEPIDLTHIDLKRVGMAWSRAGLPVSALQTMSEAIRLAHHDQGAALRVQLTVLRDGLLATATASLVDHYKAESNPTVSFSSSPTVGSPAAVEEFTYAYVNPITGKAYPPERHLHIGDKPFARRFIVKDENDDIVHVHTHVFNAGPRRSPPMRNEPVVMHFDETKAHQGPG